MLRKLSALFLVLLLVAVINPAVTIAQNEESTATQESTQSEDVTSEARAEQRKQRVDAAKEKAQAKLTRIEQKKIEDVCKSSQVVIDQLQSRVTKVVEMRQTKYADISSNLTSLSEKMGVAGIDTTELDLVITDIQTSISTSIESLESYDTLLTDISSIDCQSDPEGFKALLSEARTQRKAYIEQANETKNNLKDALKPLLEKLKDNLIKQGSTN